MAVLYSTSSGNFTSSSTWSVVDPTSYLGTISNTTAILTSYSNTTSFTPGAITVSGIGLLLYKRSGTSGTMSVQLYNLTDSVAVTGTTVTINVADLPAATSTYSTAYGVGWTNFVFGSPVTLVAGKSYCVRFLTSVANQVQYNYLTTISNPVRALITTTAGTPGSSDTIIIGGAYTGQGASTSYTVTMDNTSSTTFGAISVSSKSTLTYATSASTNYRLITNSNIGVSKGGSFLIGSSVSPFPASSTATIEITCSSAGSNFITVDGGTFALYGDTGRVPSAQLTADVALGATSSTISNSSSGWKSGDLIAVPSTTRTATDAEVVTLNANASGSTITHSAYTAAHGGNSTTLVQATVCNLTRNVKIFATTLTLPSLISIIGDDPTVIVYNVQMYGMGHTGTTQAAFTLANSTLGTFDVQYCSVYQNPNISVAYAFFCASTTVNYTLFNFNYNVVYGMGYGFYYGVVYTGANFSSAPTISYNNFIKNGYGNASVLIADPRFNFNNNNINSSAATTTYPAQFLFSYPSSTNTPVMGNWNNNTISSNFGLAGVILGTSNNSQVPITLTGWKVWRNTIGIAFLTTGDVTGGGIASASVNLSAPFTMDTWYVFGNSTTNVSFGSSTGTVIFSNSYFWGGTTLTAPFALTATVSPFSSGMNAVKFVSCAFGKDHLGNVSNYSTAIISASSYWAINYVSMYNCTFSGTEFNGVGRGGAIDGSIGIISLNHNALAGSHKLFAQNSIMTNDTSIFYKGTSSLRITPNSSSYRAFTPLNRVPAKLGDTCTISVAVRKSAAGDGAAYNGNQPRLMYHLNYLAGNTTETVGATASASAGTWEVLTYTTPAVSDDCVLEFYVDCDGTTGWINTGSWSSTTNNPSKGTDFWAPFNNGNYVEADNSGPVTTSTTFVT